MRSLGGRSRCCYGLISTYGARPVSNAFLTRRAGHWTVSTDAGGAVIETGTRAAGSPRVLLLAMILAFLDEHPRRPGDWACSGRIQ
jgi:hypothetical protein